MACHGLGGCLAALPWGRGLVSPERTRTLVSEAPSDAGVVRAGVLASLPSFLSGYPRVISERLLEGTGLDAESFASAEAVVSLRACIALLENAARETRDDGFGLALAAQLPWTDLALLGYVMLHSPTLGSALEDAARYFALQQSVGVLEVRCGPELTRISYLLEPIGDECQRQHVEFVLALLARFCRTAPTGPCIPIEVRFRHPTPPDPSRHERCFETRVRFGQAEHMLVLPSSALHQRLRSADSALLPILRRHADERLVREASSDHGLTEVVRRLLAETVGSGDVSLEAIARRIAVPPRSLQRHLRAAGRSFQQILSDTRLSLSMRFLEDERLSLTETALVLGYSDLSAFSRAFRRWTGSTPLEFRRSLLAGRVRTS